MNLIIQADPYNPEPLDDGGEEIARLVETASAGNSFSTEMSSLAGRWYSKFVQEINEAKEVRDAELTMLMVCFWSQLYCTKGGSSFSLFYITR